MEQLFGLNPQLLHDTVLMVFAILFLFTLMSYLLFNPAKKMLKEGRTVSKMTLKRQRKTGKKLPQSKRSTMQKSKGLKKKLRKS